MVGVARAGGEILIPDLRQGYSDVHFRGHTNDTLICVIRIGFFFYNEKAFF